MSMKPWIHNTRTRPIEERFWERVSIRKDDECWEWQAYRNIKKMREMYATGKFSHPKIAKMFGIGKSTVGRIVNRQMWAWVE